MIEKNKESQSQSLGELQQELKSLKALLLSRGPNYPTTPSPSLPSFVGRPSIPAWQLSGGGSSESLAPTTSGPASYLNGVTNGTSSTSQEGNVDAKETS